jgi:hypothetical protein
MPFKHSQKLKATRTDARTLCSGALVSLDDLTEHHRFRDLDLSMHLPRKALAVKPGMIDAVEADLRELNGPTSRIMVVKVLARNAERSVLAIDILL